jgi:hypothetical protein
MLQEVADNCVGRFNSLRLEIASMKLKSLKAVAAVLLVTGPFAAHADCAYPKAPATIPNGATATEAEMIAAMEAFKAYDAAVKAYGECLEEETKSKAAGTAQLMQLKTMQAKKLNAAVDELQAKAKQFNEQVRIFKARSG